MAVKVNIGCGNFKLDGYINLDNRSIVEPDYLWCWGEEFPFVDAIELAVISHVMIYIDRCEHIYGYRILFESMMFGGKLLIKEDDGNRRQWQPLGTKHRTGKIRCSTNAAWTIKCLLTAGFETVGKLRINELPECIDNRKRRQRKTYCICAVKE